LIRNHKELLEYSQKYDNMVLFVGQVHEREWRAYLEVSKNFIPQKDIEFFHIDSEEYDQDELRIFAHEYFSEKGFLIRVIRRHNLLDFK